MMPDNGITNYLPVPCVPGAELLVIRASTYLGTWGQLATPSCFRRLIC